MKARLYGNPTPFPNEALLEKLSNRLAQEDKDIHDKHLRVSISGGRVFKMAEIELPGVRVLPDSYSALKKVASKRGRKATRV